MCIRDRGVEVGSTHRGPAIADNGLHVCHSGIAIDFCACLQKFSRSLMVCEVHDLLEGERWNDYPDIDTAPTRGEKGIKNAVAGNLFILNPDPAAARADGLEDCHEWFAAIFKKVCSQNPYGEGSGGRRSGSGKGRRRTADEGQVPELMGISPFLIEFDLEVVHHRTPDANHEVMPFGVILPANIDSSKHGGSPVEDEQLAVVDDGPWVQGSPEREIRILAKVAGDVRNGPESRGGGGPGPVGAGAAGARAKRPNLVPITLQNPRSTLKFGFSGGKDNKVSKLYCQAVDYR